jgi:CopG family transcriptional regulator, nickel-responsive regulator
MADSAGGEAMQRLDSGGTDGSITILCFRNNAMKTRSLPELARLSVSLPGELLVRLDAMVEKRALPSRSQMFAELIRHALAEHSQAHGNAVLAGTVTLIYRAESGRVRHLLARTQTAFIKEVISSQHVVLEEDQSLEVLLVQGPAERLNALCDCLRKVRGVQQVKLVTTTALLPPLHSHGSTQGQQPATRSARSTQ